MSNTKQFGESGVWRGWRELGGDVCWEQYGGKWCRKDPNLYRVFYVIEHHDMVECCGSDAEGSDQYVDTISRIDLDQVPESEVESALECCCIEIAPEDYDTDESDFILVEALVSYGCAAPMGEYSDPSYPERARAAARREVESLIADSVKCEDKLDRPVNRIGSTARDFAAGNIMAGLDRYKQAQRAQEASSLSVNFGTVPSDDPLAYTFGYQHGATGRPLAESGDDDLAPAYIEGHALGVKVFNGETPPAWAKPAPSNPAMDLMAKLQG